MVELNGWYLAADKVIAIKTVETGDPNWPYKLEVVLQDQTYLTKYKDLTKCKNAARELATKINIATRPDCLETLQNRLYLIDDAVKRIDRRQLRIWRILKALLNIDNGGVENE